MGTRENTAGIKKVPTYQDLITVTNLEMSRKTVRKYSGKKNKITTRTNMTRRNLIIAKWTITKERIATRRKFVKNNLQITS